MPVFLTKIVDDPALEMLVAFASRSPDAVHVAFEQVYNPFIVRHRLTIGMMFQHQAIVPDLCLLLGSNRFWCILPTPQNTAVPEATALVDRQFTDYLFCGHDPNSPKNIPN